MERTVANDGSIYCESEDDLAYELGKRGIAYSFRYPDDGAVSTPGSNY